MTPYLRKLFRFNWILLALVLAHAPVIQAQEPGKVDTTVVDTTRARELPELNVTVTRSAEPLQRVPYAVSVLNRTELQRGQQTLGVDEALNNLPGVSCITPKGAFYAFPNVSKTGWKAKKLASALLEDAGVALIGGPDFGILGEGYIRLSYANSEENILRALERIEAFLKK